MTMMHDGQSKIVQGPLVDKSNEPKTMSWSPCSKEVVHSFQPENVAISQIAIKATA